MAREPKVEKTLSKGELVAGIASKTGLRQSDVRSVVQEFLQRIVTGLGSGRRVELRDFAVFEVRLRNPRRARNPRTGDSFTQPARHVLSVRPGKSLRDMLDGLAPEATPEAEASSAGENREPQVLPPEDSKREAS